VSLRTVISASRAPDDSCERHELSPFFPVKGCWCFPDCILESETGSRVETEVR
jgi:hypothetical protein